MFFLPIQQVAFMVDSSQGRVHKLRWDIRPRIAENP
jgi:hypothetical protein